MATEFWSQFNSAKRDLPRLALLLRSVPPAKLTAYLDHELEADQLQAVVQSLTLGDQSSWRDLHASFARLRALTHTSRLDLAWALLDDYVRRQLSGQVSVFCDAVAEAGKDKVELAELAEVRRAFA